ncbi:unnamed protein product [Rotaria magnacalcarata]|uniref:Uncharacterized protein n=2 Tax=Rotaria magnacalcarata TaxID=392030 RepID=A0A816Z2Y5_9BILA|nr:unnamed protein product [Rotaria magnacalcarata]CAF4263492.1 unnamed protein product [Rotaria magnacalcarata]
MFNPGTNDDYTITDDIPHQLVNPNSSGSTDDDLSTSTSSSSSSSSSAATSSSSSTRRIHRSIILLLVSIMFLHAIFGADQQSSRQTQHRIGDQVMIITDSDQNVSNGNHFYKDMVINSISEDGSSYTDSTSNSMTFTNSSKTHLRILNEDKDNMDAFDNDKEDEWEPKKKKQQQQIIKKKKDLFVVVSPSVCIKMSERKKSER